MSGGVDTERIRDGGGALLEDGSGGGEREVFQQIIRPSNTSPTLPTLLPAHPKNNNVNSPSKQHHRRSRRQQNRKFDHYSKRIRRNTQPAPNNNNEFLMKEHDHLFLDFENQEQHHRHHHHGDADLDNLSSNALQSSSEDDQEYLSREFKATYDNFNAERLSLMTKAELIKEYQVLQERVETLERRLKTVVYRNDNNCQQVSTTGSSPALGEMSAAAICGAGGGG